MAQKKKKLFEKTKILYLADKFDQTISYTNVFIYYQLALLYLCCFRHINIYINITTNLIDLDKTNYERLQYEFAT